MVVGRALGIFVSGRDAIHQEGIFGRGQGLRKTDQKFSSVHIENEYLYLLFLQEAFPEYFTLCYYSNSYRLNDVSNFLGFNLILSVSASHWHFMLHESLIAAVCAF